MQTTKQKALLSLQFHNKYMLTYTNGVEFVLLDHKNKIVIFAPLSLHFYTSIGWCQPLLSSNDSHLTNAPSTMTINILHLVSMVFKPPGKLNVRNPPISCIQDSSPSKRLSSEIQQQQQMTERCLNVHVLPTDSHS